MKKISLAFVILNFLTALFILVLDSKPILAQPSFDCAKASTAMELVICGDETISEMDAYMAQLYTSLRHAPGVDKNALLKSQRNFVRQRDQACARSGDALNCLFDWYQNRINELLA
ncbi:MAG: lysozyme inhibitor LprI family protein [Deltaproteobacteria bacterium]|jgi:uncharacterized protein|nr:lysozyme inhibitor LprI family protein [Deltaproteobacteria bacterium]